MQNMNQVQQHRDNMQVLEDAILADERHVVLDEPKHHFAYGTYTRELFIPADVVLTGKIHRYSCINIISQGHAKIVTDEGSFDAKAPFIFKSGAGLKKAIYALEDTVFITVHPWSGEENADLVEDVLIIPSYDEIESKDTL